jgi:hypothetical protein
MPDDIASEKAHALRTLGADVRLVRPASIIDKNQVCVLYRYYDMLINIATIHPSLFTFSMWWGF